MAPVGAKEIMLAVAMAATMSLALASPLESPTTGPSHAISQPLVSSHASSSPRMPLAFGMSGMSPLLRKAGSSMPSVRLLRAAPVVSRSSLTMVSGSGGAVLEKKPEVIVAPQGTPEQTPGKPYHVLLFNDPVNTKEYVCQVLCEVFGHSKSKAYNIMQTAHSTGFAVCNTTDKEEADLQCAKLGEKQLMSRVVEAD